jgi:outer membrane protein assembly factor BamB
VTQTHRLWHKPRGGGWLGTGVADDGLIYVCDMGGVLSCLDIPTGELRWKDRVGGSGTWSSITQDGDGRMFLLTKSGTTTVFRPDSTEFKRLYENELNESSNASVVVAGRDILVRTDSALWCFAGPSRIP